VSSVSVFDHGEHHDDAAREIEKLVDRIEALEKAVEALSAELEEKGKALLRRDPLEGER